MTLPGVLAVSSGLRLVAPDLAPPVVLGTALALHLCDAIMCRLIAHNRGYPKNLWTLLGLVGGLWAVAILIFLPRRDGLPRPPRPLA